MERHHRGVLYLFVAWSILITAMAISDAFSQSMNERVSFWLILMFIGTIFTFSIPVYYPIKHKNKLKVITAISMFLIGLYLSLYNITWELSEIIKGKYKSGSVGLYPFNIKVNIYEWYLMIAFGIALLIFGYLYYKKLFRIKKKI
jgi:hypothetical protein